MKNELRTLLMTSVLGLPVLAAAQEPQQPETRTAPEAAKPQTGARHWIRQLGSDSYRDRLEAERRLRELGDEAVPLLEKAADDASDGEVQWRARRLLRQMHGGGSGGSGGGLVDRQRGDQQQPQVAPQGGLRTAPPRQGLGRRQDDMRDEFDQLFRRFEQDFGIDVPRGRFFSDDFFRDLQEQMRAMGQGGQSRGMSMQVGPDGVRVEVEEVGEDGETEKKVYEAPDMETFRSTYPGVLQRGGLGFDVQFWPQGRMPSLWDPSQPGSPRLPVPGFPSRAPALDQQPAGPRLGVAVWPELSPELRAHLALDEGVGLMVQSVEPGSLASTLVLQAGDIVTRIGERTIGSAGDVRAALDAIAVGDDVTVVYLRKGAERTATAPRPAPAGAQGRRALQPRRGDGARDPEEQGDEPRTGAQRNREQR